MSDYDDAAERTTTATDTASCEADTDLGVTLELDGCTVLRHLCSGAKVAASFLHPPL